MVQWSGFEDDGNRTFAFGHPVFLDVAILEISKMAGVTVYMNVFPAYKNLISSNLKTRTKL